MTISVATIVKLTLGYLLNIVLAIWTYREAKRQNEKPLMWTIFRTNCFRPILLIPSN
jgi:hypothetical protein